MMPGKFDYAFVQSKNLNLKHFPVTQALVTFDVTGDDDPLTLQRMRDVCHKEFVSTQTKVNSFIPARNQQIANLSFNDRRQKKDVALVDGGNQTIQKFLTEFKKAADGKLAAFARQEAEKAKRLAAAPSTGTFALKWTVSFMWTVVQGRKAVLDMWGMESPVKIFDGIKGFVEALQGLVELLGKLRDHFADEKTLNAKVQAAFKGLASKKSFTENDVKSLEDLVSLYETRILQLQMTAKSLSAKVAHAVNLVPRDGIKPEAQRAAETELDNTLKALVKLQTTLNPMDQKLRKNKLKLGAAKAHAKKEPEASWLRWAASTGYEFKDAAFALWERNFVELASELGQKGIDALIKTFSVPENVVAKA